MPGVFNADLSGSFSSDTDFSVLGVLTTPGVDDAALFLDFAVGAAEGTAFELPVCFGALAGTEPRPCTIRLGVFFFRLELEAIAGDELDPVDFARPFPCGNKPSVNDFQSFLCFGCELVPSVVGV